MQTKKEKELIDSIENLLDEFIEGIINSKSQKLPIEILNLENRRSRNFYIFCYELFEFNFSEIDLNKDQINRLFSIDNNENPILRKRILDAAILDIRELFKTGKSKFYVKYSVIQNVDNEIYYNIKLINSF